jgi:hypothetical protein
MNLAKFTPSLLEKLKMSLASKHSAPAARAASATTALSATLADIDESDIERFAALERENPGMRISDLLHLAKNGAATSAPTTRAAAAPAPKRKVEVLFAGEAVEMTCKHCEHVFILDPKEHQSGMYCQCPECHRGARMADFRPRNVKQSAPAEAPAASPTAARHQIAPNPVQQMPVFAAAPVKERWHIVNGRAVPMTAALSSFVGKGAMLGADWKEDILGVPADSATRASSAMNAAYAENLRRSAIGGGKV